MFHLQQKCFLKLLDLSPEEITGLLDLAAKSKEKGRHPSCSSCGKKYCPYF